MMSPKPCVVMVLLLFWVFRTPYFPLSTFHATSRYCLYAKFGDRFLSPLPPLSADIICECERTIRLQTAFRSLPPSSPFPSLPVSPSSLSRSVSALSNKCVTVKVSKGRRRAHARATGPPLPKVAASGEGRDLKTTRRPFAQGHASIGNVSRTEERQLVI